MRELKNIARTSMPQFLRFPVQNEEDFERLRKERLGLNRAVRFPQSWREHVAVSGVESRVSQDLYRDAPGSRAASQPDELFPCLCFADRRGGSSARCAISWGWRTCAWPFSTSPR